MGTGYNSKVGNRGVGGGDGVNRRVNPSFHDHGWSRSSWELQVKNNKSIVGAKRGVSTDGTQRGDYK